MSTAEPPAPESAQLSVSFSKDISTEITDNLSAEFEDFEDDPVPTGTTMEKGSISDKISDKSIYYKGIVVTTIAVTKVENGKVRFNEHNGNNLKGVFLKDICMISNPNKVPIGKKKRISKIFLKYQSLFQTHHDEKYSSRKTGL